MRIFSKGRAIFRSLQCLHRRANALDPRISLSTVYRTVQGCSRRSGVPGAPHFGAGRSRYEEAGRHHDHLIDMETGKVIEFRNEEIERIQERIARELGSSWSATSSSSTASRRKGPRNRNDRAAQNLRQDLRLPDERLRFRAHAERAGAAGFAWRSGPTTPTSSFSTPATSARRRPRRSTPKSAACARDKERRAGGKEHDRDRGGMRGAGRGRGDHAPGAGGRPRGWTAVLP